MAYNFPQETKDKAVEMYIDGKSSKEIASAIGCSLDSVLKWVKDAGFETRGRGGSVKQTKLPAASSDNCATDKKRINPLLLNLAGDNNLAPYIGKEIVKMTPREIFEFLELIGVEGDLVIRQKIRLKKKSPALPWG